MTTTIEKSPYFNLQSLITSWENARFILEKGLGQNDFSRQVFERIYKHFSDDTMITPEGIAKMLCSESSHGSKNAFQYYFKLSGDDFKQLKAHFESYHSVSNPRTDLPGFYKASIRQWIMIHFVSVN